MPDIATMISILAGVLVYRTWVQPMVVKA